MKSDQKGKQTQGDDNDTLNRVNLSARRAAAETRPPDGAERLGAVLTVALQDLVFCSKPVVGFVAGFKPAAL
jgi:hypothetical protein